MVALQVSNRKAIFLESGETVTLRRRQPILSFNTIGAGIKPALVNYLGYELAPERSIDAVAVMCALAKTFETHQRSKKLKKALAELYENQLKTGVPEVERVELS